MSNHDIDLEFARRRTLLAPLDYAGKFKRAADIALVAMSLPVALPLIFILSVMVRLDGARGFFGHERIGRCGTPFICWKIRTMVPNAEEKLREHLDNDPDLAREWAESFKLKNDPRITRVGAFLRKTSLDELPQLWNILRGDMSVVGPRPVPRAELERYAGRMWAYEDMRPGLTGIWQVSGRGTCSYDERVEMDLEYARTVSPVLDCKIIVKTFGVILAKTGT